MRQGNFSEVNRISGNALDGIYEFQGDGLEVLHHHSQTPLPMERLSGLPHGSKFKM